MEKFETKLSKLKKKSIIPAVVMFIIGVAFIIGGLVLNSGSPEENIDFDKFTTKYEYVKTDIKYLMGPFANEQEDGRVTKEFYVAEGNDGNCFVIATKKDTEWPIYGADLQEEDLVDMNTVESIRVYGYADLFDSELEGFLLESFNEGLSEEEQLDSTTCTEWLGIYLIDTTKTSDEQGVGMYIMGAVFLVLAITTFGSAKKNGGNAKKAIEELKKSDKWNSIKSDYEVSTIIEYKKLNIELSNKYIFSYLNGINIIAFEDVSKVYASNMIDGKVQQLTYITIETKNNEKYYIAPKANNAKMPQFEQAINAIKEKIPME